MSSTLLNFAAVLTFTALLNFAADTDVAENNVTPTNRIAKA